jgi:hypothetical protein
MARTDVYFDSASIPVSRRLNHWQDLVGDHLACVEMRRPHNVSAEHAFSGILSLRAFQHATFAHVRSANQLLNRTQQRIRCADRETALLTLVLSGECYVAQDGKRALLRTGDMCLYESVRPYEISTPGAFEALVVMADRQSVESSVGNLRQQLGRALHFVGAHREASALLLQRIECGGNARIKTAVVGDAPLVMRQKILKHFFKPRLGNAGAIGRQPAFDQCACSCPQ